MIRSVEAQRDIRDARFQSFTCYLLGSTTEHRISLSNGQFMTLSNYYHSVHYKIASMFCIRARHHDCRPSFSNQIQPVQGDMMISNDGFCVVHGYETARSSSNRKPMLALPVCWNECSRYVSWTRLWAPSPGEESGATWQWNELVDGVVQWWSSFTYASDFTQPTLIARPINPRHCAWSRIT